MIEGERDHGADAVAAVVSGDRAQAQAAALNEEDKAWHLAVAGSGLWELCSNARQHDFVAVAVTRALRRDLAFGARQLLRACLPRTPA